MIFAPRFLAATRLRTGIHGRAGVNWLAAPQNNQVTILIIGLRDSADGITESKAPLHGADAAVTVVRTAMGDEKPNQVAVGAACRRQNGQRFRAILFFLLDNLSAIRSMASSQVISAKSPHREPLGAEGAFQPIG